MTVSAGPSCTAAASIDNGSFDPDAGDTITLSQSPAGPYALGATSVTLTVTDNHGDASSCTATVTVVDTTPPAITCPAPITVDGSLANNGAIVPFTVSATDSCDVSPAIVASPASGSLFPFGTTTVSATATDDSGNSAQCSFTVTVKSPQDLIDDLIAEINALVAQGALAENKANPLLTKLEGVSDKLDAGQVGAACNQLDAFINQINAYINSGTLTPAQGQELIAGANTVKARIGCPGTVTCPCWDETELLSVTAENQLEPSVFSCVSDPVTPAVIQNVLGSTPGVEGGFGVFSDGSSFFACATRDLPPFDLDITQAQADVCVQQIRNRCAVIGTPVP